jgi:hypothetical protein
MSQEKADHNDADLVLRVYDLRREEVMRHSRKAILGEFWPRTYEDVQAVLKPEHPLNAAYRQVGTFWEMVYSFPRHGVVHPEFFVENNGEGLFLYARMVTFVERLRTEVSPLVYRNAEWVATSTAAGKRFFEIFSARVKKKLEG